MKAYVATISGTVSTIIIVDKDIVRPLLALESHYVEASVLGAKIRVFLVTVLN